MIKSKNEDGQRLQLVRGKSKLPKLCLEGIEEKADTETAHLWGILLRVLVGGKPGHSPPSSPAVGIHTPQNEEDNSSRAL
jgi:hypothetical protein